MMRIHELGKPEYLKFLAEPGGVLYGESVGIDGSDLLVSNRGFARLRALPHQADFTADVDVVWVGGVSYIATHED